jgi:membrane-bound metal-dependent hydrolase YbcI (DUF457 family)
MPLTPFHLGPGLLIGLLLLSWIDFPTFLVASVIVDVEPILVVAFDLDYPLHGFFHSFLGGTLVAFLLAAVMSKVRASLSPLLSLFKLEHKSSFKTILMASLAGIYIHILLDSRMHSDIRPFYPLDFNPLLSGSALPGLGVYMLCFWCFVGAAVIYTIGLFLVWRRRPKNNQE